MSGTGPVRAACECELRQRAWDPNTGRCRFCGRWFKDPSAGLRFPGVEKRGGRWGVVRSYVDQLQRDNASLIVGVDAVLTLVVKDLDYGSVGVPYIYESLAVSGPWGEHLAEAYVGMLEGAAHLAAELSVNGKRLTTKLNAVPSDPTQRHLYDVHELCTSQIRAAIQLRALIKERCDAEPPLDGLTP